MQDIKKTNKLYYDGSCPMCTVFANSVDANQQDTLLVDAATAENLPMTKAAVMSEMYLIEEDGTVRTGSDAVLTTLGKSHPWLTPFVKLMRRGPFRWLARQIYSFVSLRRKLWFGGINARLYWVYLLTNLGLLSSILLTIPLWQHERLYPTIPLSQHFLVFEPLTEILSLVLFGVVIYSIFAYKNFRLLSLVSLLLILSLVLLDINRLQPLILHYSLLLFLFTFWRRGLPEYGLKVYDAAVVVTVGIYFWSGVQKINVSFFTEIFPWFSEPIWSKLGEYGLPIFLFVGLLVPFVEASMALGFLSKRLRNLSIVFSFLMLIVVLTSLTGREWNSSVWPWNIALFSMVLALFYKSETTLKQFGSRLKTNFLALGIFALFIIAPVGNVLGQVDHYLAWSLYSGHVTTATFTTSPATRAIIYPGSKSTEAIPFQEWSVGTTNIVPYPEERVFRAIFANLCQEFVDDKELTLAITQSRFFWSNQVWVTNYDCQTINRF